MIARNNQLGHKLINEKVVFDDVTTNFSETSAKPSPAKKHNGNVTWCQSDAIERQVMIPKHARATIHTFSAIIPICGMRL